jgi:hypothetical protein
MVGSGDKADDANEKSTGCSIPVLGVCGNLGNGYTADNGNGSPNGWFGSEFEADFHSGMHWEGAWPCVVKNQRAFVMSA